MIGVLIVRATQRLLDRLGGPTLGERDQSSTLFGQWYATALRWRPQVALLVDEPTLLPVLMLLATVVEVQNGFDFEVEVRWVLSPVALAVDLTK
jgi:hypothetical protein